MEAACPAEVDFMAGDEAFEAALLSLFGDSYDFGKLFNIKPFIYQQNRNRHQIQQCGYCDSSYSLLSQHISHVQCKCGANIVPCRPHSLDDCRIHTAAVHLHVKMKSSIKPLELMQLFNEFSNLPGTYFCSLCGKDTTADWGSYRSHHLWDDITHQFIPICTPYGLTKHNTRSISNISSLAVKYGEQENNSLLNIHNPVYHASHRNSLIKSDLYGSGGPINDQISDIPHNRPSNLLRENYFDNVNNLCTHLPTNTRDRTGDTLGSLTNSNNGSSSFPSSNVDDTNVDKQMSEKQRVQQNRSQINFELQGETYQEREKKAHEEKHASAIFPSFSNTNPYPAQLPNCPRYSTTHLKPEMTHRDPDFKSDKKYCPMSSQFQFFARTFV
jgi:hypothetical protein